MLSHLPKKFGIIVLMLLTLSSLILSIHTSTVAAEAELNQSLALWHKFDKIDGTTVLDSSLHSNDGTIYGGPQWVDTPFGRGIELDGTNDYIEVLDSSSLKPTAFTLSAWINGDQFQPTSHNMVLCRLGGGRGYYISVWKGEIVSIIGDGVTDYCLYSGVYPETGEWYHASATFDGSTAKIYVNGIEKNSTTVSIAYENNRVLMIGRYSAGDFYFDGSIADVRIYNRALTQEEIAQEVLGAPFSEIHSFVQRLDLDVGGFRALGNGFTLALEDIEEGAARLALYEVFSKSNELTLSRDNVDENFVMRNLRGDPVLEFSLRTVGENSVKLGSVWVAESELTAPIPIVQNIIGAKWFFDDELSRYMLELDGANDYVDVGSPSGMAWGTGDFSFAIWLQAPSHDKSVRYLLDAKTVEHADAWGLYLGTDDRLYSFARASNGTWTGAGSDDVLATGEWVFVYAHRKNGTIEMWLNGVKQATTTTGANMNYSSPDLFRIGGQPYRTEYYFEGIIADIFIYDRALSDFEIESLYNGVETKNGLVSHWKFDEGDGDTVYDETSHSNDGTIHNIVRTRYETVLWATIQNEGQRLLERASGLRLEIYIDGENVKTEDLSQLELQACAKTYVRIKWQPTELGEHEIEVRIIHEFYNCSYSKKFDVEPPINPPVEFLLVSALETGGGVKLFLDVRGEWGYPGESWDNTAKVEVYRRRLYGDVLVYELEHHISGTSSELTMPYKDFYEGDGEYIVRVHFMDVESETLVRVAGEDEEYNSPRDLLWLTLAVAISYLMILGYLLRTRRHP